MITLNIHKCRTFPVMGKRVKDDKELLKELGKRISEIRKEKGLTQMELGFRCDIEKPNMNRIEKGGTNPTFLTLNKICRELEISFEEVVKGLS
jgi:transcriptional regulator with XRE-family HTH domain